MTTCRSSSTATSPSCSGTVNEAGDGGVETATFTREGGTAEMWVVIRNVGNTTGGYTLTSAEE